MLLAVAIFVLTIVLVIWAAEGVRHRLERDAGRGTGFDCWRRTCR